MKNFILVVFLLFGSAQAARAETACRMIDSVTGTLSIVIDIQRDQNDVNYLTHMSELTARNDQISLTDLIPTNMQGDFSAEEAALFHYVSNLRKAIASQNSGFDDDAKETLKKGGRGELMLSLKSLTSYWNCRPETELFDREGVPFTEKALYGGGSRAKNQTGTGELARTVIGQSKRGPRSVYVGGAKRVTFGGVIPKLDPPAVIVGLFLTLLVVFYGLQKRSKSFKVREKRRLLHKPINIRLGKMDYAMMLVDISMNGSKIQHNGVIKRPGKLRILLNGVWYRGHIKWQNDLFAGIRFKRPFNHQDFSLIVQSSQQN